MKLDKLLEKNAQIGREIREELYRREYLKLANKMKTTHNISIIFNLDAKYVWHILPNDTGATYKSSTAYKTEKAAEEAAYDFAAKHGLAVGNIIYQ